MDDSEPDAEPDSEAIEGGSVVIIFCLAEGLKWAQPNLSLFYLAIAVPAPFFMTKARSSYRNGGVRGIVYIQDVFDDKRGLENGLHFLRDALLGPTIPFAIKPIQEATPSKNIAWRDFHGCLHRGNLTQQFELEKNVKFSMRPISK